jgi:cytochrome P450
VPCVDCLYEHIRCTALYNYTQYRAMVADVFSRDNVEALRPKMNKIVEQCLEDFIAAGDHHC